MTTITATLKANDIETLKDAIACATQFYSSKRISGTTVTLTWICETGNRNEAINQVQENISASELENLNVELVAIG